MPFEEPSLSAEIIASGGKDIKISSNEDIPDNVSIDSYKLNQQMVIPLKGKTTSEALEIINNYLSMVDEKEYDEEMLEELIAFRTVSKQANRIKCATIGIKGFVQLIEESEKSHE